MSDSSSENEELESYRYYGKPLDPYDEDAFPKKRPITVEEQIATDERGRRRFHGAFTGGFSAGFFNTVGSLEGWKPSEFRSSRSEKGAAPERKPEDYMDDEDMGEFGIAPHMVQATKEFSTKKKRKKTTASGGPIPGVPVLETLIEGGNETVGYLLLRNLGFKHGDENDVGSDDDGELEENQSQNRVYGCEIPKTYAIKRSFDNQKFNLPDVYVEALRIPKTNTFGLGYSGLEKNTHVNLFQSSNLVVHDKDRKLSIKGQAFGVGAFEEDDDDIYMRDDMSGYDFEMTAEKAQAKKPSSASKMVLGLFEQNFESLKVSETFPPPSIPHSFTGKHRVKKSRFAPLESEVPDDALKERGSLSSAIRAKYLGEDAPDPRKITISTNIISQPPKQPAKDPNEREKLNEFAEKQRKAVDTAATGFLLDRFVSGSKADDPHAILEQVERTECVHGTQQMRDAVKIKMFGAFTRETFTWQPCAILCKRFNVPEPLFKEFGSDHNRKRTKNLIFQLQEFKENAPDLKPGLSVQAPDKDNATKCLHEENIDDITQDGKTEGVVNEIPVASTSESILEKVESVIIDKALSNETVNVEELNLPPVIDMTEKVNVAEHRDLFASIFDDSDEEIDAVTEQVNTTENTTLQEVSEIDQRTEMLKATILSEELFPKIKPLRVGILSDIKFSKKTSEVTKEDDSVKVTLETECVEIITDKTTKTELSEQNNALQYGPKLPDKILFKKPESAINICIKDSDSDSNSEDDWVEKSDTGVVHRKHKSPKKHKKDKKAKKHKKHKHKNKKKS